MEKHLRNAGISATPHQLQQLQMYAAMLRERNAVVNLIAASTVDDLEVRHLLDSAQLVKYLPTQPCKVVDVGTGAGLPGIVLAILLPRHQFVLVEKVGKKVTFLKDAVQALGLTNVRVWPKQVAELKETFAVITCRAWAGLEDILTQTKPLLGKGGEWCLLKGQAVDDEIKVSLKAVGMTIQRHPSITSSTGVVLQLKPVPRGTDTKS